MTCNNRGWQGWIGDWKRQDRTPRGGGGSSGYMASCQLLACGMRCQ